MSKTWLFDMACSNVLCSGVTEASLFICAFLFSLLQGVARQEFAGDAVAGQIGKGWAIRNKKKKNH